jgi:ABC-type antimicrobial peptide transport system permease subunit
VTRLLSGQALLLVLVGAVAGIALYGAALGWVRTLLYGVEASDPVGIGAALFFVVAIVALAVLRPIRRAIRLAPAAALRQE